MRNLSTFPRTRPAHWSQKRACHLSCDVWGVGTSKTCGVSQRACQGRLSSITCTITGVQLINIYYHAAHQHSRVNLPATLIVLTLQYRRLVARCDGATHATSLRSLGVSGCAWWQLRWCDAQLRGQHATVRDEQDRHPGMMDGLRAVWLLYNAVLSTGDTRPG